MILRPRRRHEWTLADYLARAGRRTGVLWCSVALAAVVIYLAPPYMRFYG